MSSLNNMFDKLRSLDLAQSVLRPAYPPVAIQLDRESLSIVRLKRKPRGLPLFEAYQSSSIPPESVPASIFEARAEVDLDLPQIMQELFEKSGTKPGRVSLVIPDNLAKISLLTLPERPGSRKHLDALVKSLMRRAVPFKIEDASLSYQVLPTEGQGVTLLVSVVRRAFIEQYEKALESLGAQTGLVDLSTPNLINLARGQIREAGASGGDVALLNVTSNYFSLAIVRKERMIFFRCKTYAVTDQPTSGANGVLSREVANSFGYYKEKLSGEGVTSVLVRSLSVPMEAIGEKLQAIGIEDIRSIDTSAVMKPAEGISLDGPSAQQLAPAIGAAVGRGR